MAHIEKRGPGRWRARYREPGGAERSRTFKRRVDAERFITGVEHSKLAGSYVDPAAGRTTFRSYAECWRKLQPHRASTATSLETDLRLHVYPTLGERPLGAIRASEVQALVTTWSTRLASTTLARVYGRVTAVFRAAVHDRVIPTSPCLDVRLPRATSNAVSKVLTSEQVFELADAMPRRYRGAILVGAGTGLRPGELFGLTVDRVDFLRRLMRVDRQLVRARGAGVRLDGLKTSASYRTVPLPTVVIDALASHLVDYPADELGLVFTNERGGPVQQHPFSVAWRKAQESSGIPSWATPHDLRHYYASLLIRAGASVKVVQARLGHSSAKVTLDVYSHLWPDDEDRTRAAVDDELGALAAYPRPAGERPIDHPRSEDVSA
jgi:integrase